MEVKASRSSKFGDLSERSRDQLRDAVTFVERLRAKASLVKDPALKAKLSNAYVEVFSDVDAPKRGEFKRLMQRGLIVWNKIRR